MGEYGKTLVAEGRSDDALAFLERAIELQPGDWALYSAQGVAYDQKANYKAAQISYGRALAIKPGEPTVLSNDALSHVQTGDLDGAEKLLLQASEQGGDYPRIASNLALVKSLRSAKPETAPEAVKTAAQAASRPPGGEAPVSVARAPVDSAALPSPAQKDITALEKDPSVVMQAVPSDSRQAAKETPVRAAEKPPAKKPLQTLASDDDSTPLRRLSDADLR
jgi:tetratricopeptide (TPR) repeat protein